MLKLDLYEDLKILNDADFWQGIQLWLKWSSTVNQVLTPLTTSMNRKVIIIYKKEDYYLIWQLRSTI